MRLGSVRVWPSGWGFPGVEAEQLVPAFAVAQEPGGDLPQVISGQDPVGPGPRRWGVFPPAGGLARTRPLRR